MSFRAPGRLAIVLLVLAVGVGAQTLVPVYLPSNTPGTGAGVVQPFGLGAVTNVAGYTVVQQIPAAALSAAGLGNGSTLVDLALAPTGSGVITANNFVALAGFTTTPWDPTQLIGNVFNAQTIWDSTVQGAFSWTVTANQWNDLNSSPVGLVWDGISDLVLYMSASGVNVQSTGTGGPIIQIWLGTFRSAGGLYPRNIGSGFQTVLPSSTDNNGLEMRLIWGGGVVGQPGTVTFLPTNQVLPGNSITCVFNAPGFGGQLYAPFVACNNVPATLQGVNLPLSFDVCSVFYFNDPFGPVVFNLAGGGHVGTLSPVGLATGTINIPAFVSPGLNLDVWVTYVTLGGTAINVHGFDFFTVL